MVLKQILHIIQIFEYKMHFILQKKLKDSKRKGSEKRHRYIDDNILLLKTHLKKLSKLIMTELAISDWSLF